MSKGSFAIGRVQTVSDFGVLLSVIEQDTHAGSCIHISIAPVPGERGNNLAGGAVTIPVQLGESLYRMLGAIYG